MDYVLLLLCFGNVFCIYVKCGLLLLVTHTRLHQDLVSVETCMVVNRDLGIMYGDGDDVLCSVLERFSFFSME